MNKFIKSWKKNLPRGGRSKRAHLYAANEQNKEQQGPSRQSTCCFVLHCVLSRVLKLWGHNRHVTCWLLPACLLTPNFIHCSEWVSFPPWAILITPVQLCGLGQLALEIFAHGTTIFAQSLHMSPQVVFLGSRERKRKAPQDPGILHILNSPGPIRMSTWVWGQKRGQGTKRGNPEISWDLKKRLPILQEDICLDFVLYVTNRRDYEPIILWNNATEKGPKRNSVPLKKW